MIARSLPTERAPLHLLGWAELVRLHRWCEPRPALEPRPRARHDHEQGCPCVDCDGRIR